MQGNEVVLGVLLASVPTKFMVCLIILMCGCSGMIVENHLQAPDTIDEPGRAMERGTEVLPDPHVSVTSAPRQDVVPDPLPPPSVCTSESFGNPYIGGDLSNFPVGPRGYCGGANNEYSIRFKATTTGAITQLRAFLVTGPGYAGGNGGHAYWDFHANDPSTQRPTGPVIGSIDFPLNYTNGECGNTFQCEINHQIVDSPPQLEAGKYYHLVLRSEGTDATNFYSLDEMFDYVSDGAGPAYDVKDFNVLRKCYAKSGQGAWETETWNIDSTPSYHIPAIEFTYNDGTVQGSGYMEGYHANRKAIDSTLHVRQVIQVDSNRCFRRVKFYASKQAGTRMVATLRDSTNQPALDIEGNPVAPVTIDTSSKRTNYYDWYLFDVGTTVLLKKGVTYHLDLSAPEGSFTVVPLRDGSQFGFKPPTTFLGAASYAQFSTNAGTNFQDWYAWGNNSNFKYGDLSLWFSSEEF